MENCPQTQTPPIQLLPSRQKEQVRYLPSKDLLQTVASAICLKEWQQSLGTAAAKDNACHNVLAVALLPMLLTGARPLTYLVTANSAVCVGILKIIHCATTAQMELRAC